ncbi:MAG: hypothetical protein IT469_06175, partial [Pseudomonadales bacterium]|nr:hypothetical protein [Pseudomonadales bacterium]
SGERTVAPGIAYVLDCDLLDLHNKHQSSSDPPPDLVRLESQRRRFELSSGNGAWKMTATAGFEALRVSGRVSANEPLIRVRSTEVKADTLVMNVQLSQYHDQARSNLILDFDRENPGTHVSLRSQLCAKYDGCLPDLSDGRLANTLGVAMLIYYRSNGTWIPYLVRRVKKIGVFPGGVHCSASGAAKWPARSQTVSFADVTDHLLDEAKEELGLLPADLSDFRPVSYCREMARGGKPQLFYCALTTLSRKELAERRKHAARVARELKLWEEIERDRWYRSADVVMSASRLRHGLAAWGVTLEGAASLYFGSKYLRILSRQ